MEMVVGDVGGRPSMIFGECLGVEFCGGDGRFVGGRKMAREMHK